MLNTPAHLGPYQVIMIDSDRVDRLAVDGTLSFKRQQDTGTQTDA